MTDIARKRTFTEITKNQQSHKIKPIKENNEKAKNKIKKTEVKKEDSNQEDQTIVKTQDQKNENEIKDDEQHGFDGTLSLASFAISQPARLKKLIDDQINTDLTPFLKTIFLYFFEITGLNKQDADSLKILFERLLAAKSNVGVEKDISKPQQEQLKIDFDKNVYYSVTKNAQAHLRTFKRVIKLLISGLVDNFPAKQELLPCLVEKIISFSRSKMRILRYSFTQIGLQLFKQLLGQSATLSQLRNQFKSQPSVSKQENRIEIINKALDFVRDKGTSLLAKELVRPRAVDCIHQIRKAVIEMAGDLETIELKSAFEVKELQLMNLLGNALKDIELNRVALSSFHHVVTNGKLSQSKKLIKEIENVFEVQKTTLINKVLPSGESQNDPQQMVKSIQILSEFGNKLSKDTISTIINNMHHGSPQVREEAAKFLLTVQSDFKNGISDLLPIQKSAEDDKDFAVNFYLEPNQSKRQLSTLVQLVSQHVLSRKHYFTLVKLADPDVVIVDQNDDSALNISGDALSEEQAGILVGVFGRLTSVVFDVSALTDLLTKEDQNQSMKELLSYVLYSSIVYMKRQCQTMTRIAVGSSTQNVIFRRFWEQAVTNLKLSKLNELLQSNRDSPAIVEPLLRVLMLMEVQPDESESFADILNLVKIGLTKYEVGGNHTILIKTMSKCLRKLYDWYSPAKDVSRDLLMTLQDSIKDSKESLPLQAICKYNILLSHHNLSALIKEDQIKSAAKWAVYDFSSTISKYCDGNDAIGLKQILQLSFYHIENLVQICSEDDPLIELLIQQLAEDQFNCLFQLFAQYKDKHESQLAVFAFITEIFQLCEPFQSKQSQNSLQTFLLDFISQIVKPFNFPESTSSQLFILLTNMLDRSPSLFSSGVGHEYLLTFVCQPQLNGKHEKAIKRLLANYKQRDSLEKTKRSSFYCMIAKALFALSEVSEQRALKVLSVTVADLKKNVDLQDLPAQITAEELSRIVLLLKVIRLVQSSIVLIVNLPAGSRSGGFTKMQDEQAYSLMIEDFCKFALRRKQVYLLRLMPTLMHAGFISAKTFDAICNSLAALKENKDEKLSMEEIQFIQVNCLEIVQTKWSDKNKLKKENPQTLENAFVAQPAPAADLKKEKEDEPEDDQDLVASFKEQSVVAQDAPNEIQIDTTDQGQEKMQNILDQIGKKRNKPPQNETRKSRMQRKD